ncbi:MAG: hypothetical protein U0670_03000 [Anaerolineae bacterium]
MTAPLCPKCNTPMDFRERDSLYICPFCDHKRYETLDEAQARLHDKLEAQTRAPNLLRFNERSQISHRALIHYEDAQAKRMRGDDAGALDSLDKAIECEPAFLDAHFWAAKLAADPKVKRDHLSTLLAHDPGNMDAQRELMVLDGRLTPEEAERSKTQETAPLVHVDAPIKAQTETLLCPACGGTLTADEANGRVFCKFCGHSAPLPKHEVEPEALSVALIKQRAQTKRWVIGERIVHCNHCGAERTIPARQLSMVCPFCGSTHVIETDALNTFTNPDGLVHFSVTEQEAGTIIREKLKGLGERLVGLFDDNRIARAMLLGTYLPFWVFDVIVDVRQTIIQIPRSSTSERSLYHPVTESAYQTNQISDAMLGVIIPAVTSPLPALISKITDYEIGAVQAYDAELLARYPARLYDKDFDKASLDAREVVSAHMRDRHCFGAVSDRDTTVNVTTLVKSMTFMLLLLPVWIGTLYEKDGDVRTVLVNGQTGSCVLGKAEKIAG